MGPRSGGHGHPAPTLRVRPGRSVRGAPPTRLAMPRPAHLSLRVLALFGLVALALTACSSATPPAVGYGPGGGGDALDKGRLSSPLTRGTLGNRRPVKT